MRPIPDPRKVYHHGIRFLVADHEIRRTSVGNKTLTEWVMLPAIVLSAFASELFLKSLIIIEGKHPPDSHNLHTLFKRLHNKNKDGIVARWDKNVTLRENEFKKNEVTLGIKIPRDLRSALVDCGDAFERMRYLYEDPINAKFYIIDFAQIVQEQILQLKPDWR